MLNVDQRIIANHDQHLAIARDHLATMRPGDVNALMEDLRLMMLNDQCPFQVMASYAVLGMSMAYLSALEVVG